MAESKSRYFQTLLFLLGAISLFAQNEPDSIKYSLNTRMIGSQGTYAPFLSTANQYDRYSFSPNSLALWGTAHKEITAGKIVDYGFGMELNGNISKDESHFFAGEFYAEGKIYFLNVYAGRKQQVFGNQDTELSSGGMLWSKNSRPVPRIAIQTNEYLHVPYLNGFAEIKGGLSHGWLNDYPGINHLLLHHKFGYLRLGGSLPVKLNYGIQHVVQWGGQSEQYGTMPVTLDNYLRIFLGKSGNATASMSDQINTLGNHIISQNLGMDINLTPINISLYWQNITEDPPVKFITNTPTIEDGLWGMSIRLPGWNILNHVVFEYMSTTDQNGPWHDLDGVIYGGQDSYYTNGMYPAGWSYKKMSIGNPWITSPKYNEDGSTATTNNTVRLYYFSGKGKIKATDYRLTLAYSENFGLTKPIYTECKKQFSWQLETLTPMNVLKGATIILGVSGDKGTMYGNKLALFAGLSYSGLWKF
jgi:hypothetical protein